MVIKEGLAATGSLLYLNYIVYKCSRVYVSGDINQLSPLTRHILRNPDNLDLPTQAVLEQFLPHTDLLQQALRRL